MSPLLYIAGVLTCLFCIWANLTMPEESARDQGMKTTPSERLRRIGVVSVILFAIGIILAGTAIILFSAPALEPQVIASGTFGLLVLSVILATRW